MKRSLGLLAAALLLAGGFAFAEEATLIDFTTLDADILPNANGNPTQNRRTVMDYSLNAGSTYTQDQKDLMKTSLALSEWEVELNASARNVESVSNSIVVPAPVNADAEVPFAGSNVMGVRVVFPEWQANANARVKPSFDIPAYDKMISFDESGNAQPQTDEQKAARKTRFEADEANGPGYGVVKNVGTLKSLAVTTMGMNFPHALYVLLEDTDGVEHRYFMGYLGFDGWKELKWNNPVYVSEIRTREIRIYPIYPRGLPFVKFNGFQVVRDASMKGGDFIGYFKDVKIIYDKALLTTERDINDEDLWHIVGDREADKQAYEMSIFGQKQVNRYLEKDKMATEEEFTSSLEAAGNDTNAPVAQ